MSHELRTPLNGIAGYVDLLEMGRVDEAVAWPEQALTPAQARGAAGSLVVLAVDGRGEAWQDRRVWDFPVVASDVPLSPDSELSVVAESSLPDGSVVPVYDPAAGANTMAALCLLSSADPRTVLRDFETLVDAFGSLNDYVSKQGIKPSGPALTIFTETSDRGFQFLAALPIDAPPANPPKGDIAIGKAPTGRALKFTHRGSYDAMDTTYEAITNYLDEKRLDAKDMFIEEYTGGPLKPGDEKLLVYVYVPVK